MRCLCVWVSGPAGAAEYWFHVCCCLVGVGLGLVVWWGWLCFENWIVDASIFIFACCKFLRAHGGCLGIRNR